MEPEVMVCICSLELEHVYVLWGLCQIQPSGLAHSLIIGLRSPIYALKGFLSCTRSGAVLI